MGKISEALEKSEREKRYPVPQMEEPLPPLPEMKEETTPDPFMPLPAEANEIDEKVITISKPNSFEAEQFRHLRNSLMYTASTKPIRSLMITSTVSEEGKTFVACNLAASVAKNINQHVLLIDCDLRRPSVHKFFNIRNEMGLSSYLTNGSRISGLLIRTPIEKLTILPAGKPPRNPSELLSSENMKMLLDEVKARYPDRYIIIDSPPPHLAAETNALATFMDGILLVIKYGTTHRDLVAEVVDRISKKKIIGVVFNQFNSRHLLQYGQLDKYYSRYSRGVNGR